MSQNTNTGTPSIEDGNPKDSNPLIEKLETSLSQTSFENEIKNVAVICKKKHKMFRKYIDLGSLNIFPHNFPQDGSTNYSPKSCINWVYFCEKTNVMTFRNQLLDTSKIILEDESFFRFNKWLIGLNWNYIQENLSES